MLVIFPFYFSYKGYRLHALKETILYILIALNLAYTENTLSYTWLNLFMNINIVTQNFDKVKNKLVIFCYLFQS